MSNLIFSLNATMPVFLVMMLGYIFRKTGFISESFASSMNSFVFKIALPVNLFVQLYEVDFWKLWDTSYVVYCFAVSLLSALIAFAFSFLVRDKDSRGEFVQGAYRSSVSLLGMTYMENIYNDGAMGTLMMLGSVPLYNVLAVLVLSLMKPGGGTVDRARLRGAFTGILKNPIIWGILLGFGWSLSGLHMPEMLSRTAGYIGRMASPMGLIALGASLDFADIRRKIGPAVRPPTCHARLRGNGGRLCHGEEHGTQRDGFLRHCDADNGSQSLYIDALDLAVPYTRRSIGRVAAALFLRRE